MTSECGALNVDETMTSSSYDDDFDFGSTTTNTTSSRDESWEELDIDEYMNSDGVNILLFNGTDDIDYLISPLDADESTDNSIGTTTESAKGAGTARKKEAISVAPKRKHSAVEITGGKTSAKLPPKRRRLTSLAASEKVYQFPAKLFTALNAGNDKLLSDIVHEYCVEDCILKTKVVPEGIKGREAIITFFTAVYSSCPDMMMTASDLRLKRDLSIVMKGKYEGTYVDERNGKHDYLMYKKEKPLAQEVSESRGANRNRPLSATEVRELENLDRRIKENPKLKVVCNGVYAARVHFRSAKVGAAPGAPPHQLVTCLDWDWKTLNVFPSSFVDEE